MTSEWIGALVGLLLGIVSYLIISALANKMERDEKTPESMRIATLLRAVACFDVLLFTVIGYFVGPMVLT